MSPKMRSIFAKIHRKSLSMASRRDFSSSSAASSGSKFAERDLYSAGISFRLGFCAYASLVAYKVYKNYYPKLLISNEEHKRMSRRINELRAQAKLDLDI